MSLDLVDFLDPLAARRVILFGGKGGAGKTTIASLAALHFAQTRPVILFTTDPASSLADLFDEKPENITIEALDAGELYARFLEKNLDAFLELGDRGTYLDRDELRRFFELSLPGADELMAWSRIGELAEANPGANIIVDTAPTGHTVRMLFASQHFAQLGRALDALQEKHRAIARQLTRKNVRDAMDAFIESFEADANRRRELLRAGAFVPIALSERWVVEQTNRLIEAVRAERMDVPFVVLNRTAAQCDCERCRQQAHRDQEARTRFERVVGVPRSCTALDSVRALRAFLRSAGAPEPEVHRDRPLPARRSVPRPAPGAKFTFFAGKGGVGKTTLSSSYALQLARSRPAEKFVIISVDPAHSLRDVFASEDPPPNLAVEAIDTRARWRDFRETLGGEIERAVQSITPSGLTLAYDTEAMRELIELAPPGADELFAVTRLADLASDDAVAHVVIDTAPTGHFLRLVDLPETAGEWVHEFMRILLRYREVVSPGSLGEELVRASRSLHALDESLRSQRAAVIVVTRPERIVIAETGRLIGELQKRGIAVGTVIANYVTPESECRCDRSMRAFEAESLRAIGRNDVAVIDRRDAPVLKLDDIASLLDLH